MFGHGIDIIAAILIVATITGCHKATPPLPSPVPSGPLSSSAGRKARPFH